MGIHAGYAAVRMHLPPPSPRMLGGSTMGTRWSLKYAEPAGSASVAPERLRAAVEQVLDTVVAQMSTWEATSDVSRFNRSQAGSRHALSPAFAAVMECALYWARASGGAFDPTVGSLVDAWGFGPRPGERDYSGVAPPTDAQRIDALARVGWQRLEFDPVGCMLRQPGAVQLDLSGIAKGFAVDLHTAPS